MQTKMRHGNVTGKSTHHNSTEQPLVVHIAPTPFFANRGCHIRILNEIDSLRERGRRVILCTYGLGNDVADLDIRRIWKIPGYTKTAAGFSLFKPLADILLFFLVFNVVRQERVSVIHGHLHEGGLIGWCVKLALFWRRIFLVMDVQGSLSGELRAYGTFKKLPFLLPLFYFVERLVSMMPDRIICSSRASARFMTESCRVSPQKIEIVKDVVPSAFFLPADKDEQRALLHVPASKDVVIYTGSLLPGKGADLLMNALRLVLECRQDCLFVLIGYPKDQVEKEVILHGLQDRVILPGEVPYSDLADWLATADLAIDPKPSGSGEASGKILHYMARGLGIVCFATDNNRQFLDGDGFYAADESASGLASAIDLALTDAESRNMYGASCRLRAQKDFSLNAVGRQLEYLYRHAQS